MLYPLWTAKPGSGGTSVATLLAAALARAGRSTLLVDLGGDLPLVVGDTIPTNAPGVTDWMASDAGPDALGRLEVAVTASVSLLPRGRARQWSPGRSEALVAALTGDDRDVVVDVGAIDPDVVGGSGPASTTLDGVRTLLAEAAGSLLVIGTCYLALRRATAMPIRPSGVVVVRTPGRGVDHVAVADALGVRVAARVDADPAVARAVDAGLLLVRPPRVAVRQVAGILR